MAHDVITLLNFVGWTEKHQVHVVGVSLGGMIAQGTAIVFDACALCDEPMRAEVASRIPERIVSLSLIVTKAGRRHLVDLPSVSFSE